MMLRLISRNLANQSILKNDRLRLIVSLNNNYASEPGAKLKGDETSEDHRSNNGPIYHDQPKEEKTEEQFEPNLFMNDLELLNLSDEDRQKYQDYTKKPFYYRFAMVSKVMTRNLYELLKNELLATDYMSNEKYVQERQVDCVWEFKKKEDIKGWLVACDQDMDKGFSTTKLEVNKNGRLVFSGHLECDKLPLDGVIETTGFAHLSSPFKKTGFGLESFHNWTAFNHFVIRFRGDGRAYKILIRPTNLQGAQTDSFYEYYLYTRGGPYWQTAKIPFSKFLLCYAGRIQEKTRPLMKAHVQSFGITVAKYTGPYRLEISHIGMQLDKRNYQEFDYEGYFRPELM